MIRLLLTDGHPPAREALCMGLGAAVGVEVGIGDELLAQLARATRGLSKRKMEVLGLVAEGLTNDEIALKLFISKRTVETLRHNIMDKTQTRNTAALITLAARQGLLSE